jgi:hypothetical protein
MFKDACRILGALVVLGASLPMFCFAAEPQLNIINDIDFGEVFGMSGICHLDASTNAVTDGGGGLCQSSDPQTGEPGTYIIVGNPNTSINVQIKIRPNTDDGFTFTPDGMFEVFGQPDIPIIANQNHVVPTGDSGVITIKLGGTLNAVFDQNFNSSYSIELINGIIFNELP